MWVPGANHRDSGGGDSGSAFCTVRQAYVASTVRTVSDRIKLSQLSVDCVVGVYPHERNAVQPLIVDTVLHLDTQPAAKTERLSHTVDYGMVAAQIRFLLSSCRFRMLETAADVLCRFLLAPAAHGENRVAIERVELRLTKPFALAGQAIPSLEVDRAADWVKMGKEEKPFGTVDVIAETQDAGVYRLNIKPGQGIPLHVHRVMQESEMVLTDGLLCQGKPSLPGMVHRWPLGAKHRYDNPSSSVQSVLCVDCPPFIEADEIEVDGQPSAVAPER